MDQLSLQVPQADLKHTQVTAIFAIHQMAETGSDRAGAHRHAPDVQKGHRQGQARQTPGMSQHRALQIKAMSFQIAKHLLGPHPASIRLQDHPAIRQVRGQTPQFVLAHLPVDQQVNRAVCAFGQGAFSQPEALSRLFDAFAKVCPHRFM